ncbi:MAG: MBOAT family protein [Halioglobus sp.]
MLFNSYEFLFFFLPITAVSYWIIGRFLSFSAAIYWLVFCSLFFYGWWEPKYLTLLVPSIVVNYFLGKELTGNKFGINRRLLLFLGVAANLSLIGYFKYYNFFLGNVSSLFGVDAKLEDIVLPLAISFFTFQQIAYLVDAYRHETKEYSFSNYILFVTFFPQLIAGPIVHHKEMLPQFGSSIRISWSTVSIGLTIFLIGLFKKVVIADNAALYAIPIFSAAENGVELNLMEAWLGSLAYTFQLYFDFSGYSDMAIGLARIFGIRLPLNFNSPYKAENISIFWRRWHMTLSRFLRDYLYIVFGGNRRGEFRRNVNLMLTMVLGGLWHGAGWNFVIWGALHGFYLVVHRVWQLLSERLIPKGIVNPSVARVMSVLITFLVVVVAWVFFRAVSFDGAINILKSMFGFHGGGFSAMLSHNIIGLESLPLVIALALTAWFMPNTQQLLRYYRPALNVYKEIGSNKGDKKYLWRPSVAWGVFIGLSSSLAILSLGKVSEFLYFQF